MIRRLNIFISHPSPLLTNHQPHGDGLAAWEFVSRLARRGHKVHVAALAYDITGPLPEELTIHPYRLHAPTAAIQRFEAIAKIRGIFNRLARDMRFDLIHQLNPVCSGLSAGLLRAGVPLVLGPFVPSWPNSRVARGGFIRRVWRSIFDHLNERANLAQQRTASLLLLSTSAAASALNVIESDGRARILSYGVDTQLYVPMSEEPPFNDLAILFLANLQAYKGIFVLLEAFDIVSAAIPQCLLYIAGDGPSAGEVQRRIATMAARDRIRMLGAIRRDRVADVMRSSTVYCLPSYSEPFGITALEAMACGKPLVGTDQGGLAHIVETPQGGRKVPVGDATALAEALMEILKSPDLARSMGRRNRLVAVERYEWERVIDHLEEAYGAVIGTPNEARA
jgi:glycosyltransferase involved in cell wall biosynthesis